MGLLSSLLPAIGTVAGGFFGGPLGASIGGALGGAVSSKDGTSTTQQAQTRDPWAAAQPWMRDMIAQGQGLQQHYAANPFSHLQQQQYGNQFGLLNALNQMAPQFTANNNAMMQGYDRYADPKTRSKPQFQPMSLNFNPGLLNPEFNLPGVKNG